MALIRGGGNWVDLFPITAGAVVTGEKISLQEIEQSEFSSVMLMGQGGADNTLTLTQFTSTEEFYEFLVANGTATPVADIQKTFENGTNASTGTGQLAKVFFVAYGPLVQGKRMTTYGVCSISGGGRTNTYSDAAAPELIITGQAWTGAAGLTIPSGAWEETMVETDSPTPALPTSVPNTTPAGYPQTKFLEAAA